ncbi:glycosyl-4,4'-diaponeurosporenoate acyltransferase CrtO family protein [Algoriphagus namhaensis]
MIQFNPKIISVALNQALNLFWTLLAFAPIVLIWYLNFNLFNLLMLILLSILFAIFFRKYSIQLQLSNNRKFYERLGVKRFQKFTQDSHYINRLIERAGGEKPYFRKNLNLHQTKKIEMYEAYHAACLLFFFISTFIGFYNYHFSLAILAKLANIIYNVIPLFIQQYNRIRLKVVLRLAEFKKN